MRNKKILLLAAAVLFLHFLFPSGVRAQDKDAVQKELDKYGIKKDSSKDGAKDSPKEQPKDSPKDKPKDTPKDKPKEEGGNGGLTNTGDSTLVVSTENVGDGAKTTTTVKPGKSTDFPKGTVAVHVVVNGGGQGNYMISQPNGSVKSHDTKNMDSHTVDAPNTVTNHSPEPVVVTTDGGGTATAKTLQPGESAEIPPGTTKVNVDKDPMNPPKDKNAPVKVRVVDGNGDTSVIDKWGGKTKVEPKKEKPPSVLDDLGHSSNFGDDLKGSSANGTLARDVRFEDHPAEQEHHHHDQDY